MSPSARLLSRLVSRRYIDHPIGAMEHLDGAAGDAHIDLGADQTRRRMAWPFMRSSGCAIAPLAAQALP
jgi:hypothetical protein